MTEGQYQALEAELAQALHLRWCDKKCDWGGPDRMDRAQAKSLMPIVQRELAARDAVIEQIRALHPRYEPISCFGSRESNFAHCGRCMTVWPCETARLLSSLPSTGESE